MTDRSAETPTETIASAVSSESADAVGRSGWDLSELVADTSVEAVTARLDALQRAVTAFETHRPALTDALDGEKLLEVLRDLEAIVEEMHVLGSFGSLWFSENTLAEPALNYRNRVDQAITELYNRILFFGIWWKQLDQAVVDRLYAALETEPDFQHYLDDVRRLGPFTLDETSEQIINLKDANGMSGLLTVFSMLTNRLEFELEVDGEVRRMTRAEISAYVTHPDASVRERAYRELFRVFEPESAILAQIYGHRVRDWASEKLQLRGFASPISARNMMNDIGDDAVEVLLEVCREQAKLYRRYFSLKAGWIGREKLRRYDLYAPLAESTRNVPYGAAVGLVLETFGAFDPRFRTLAERVFRENHVDSELRRGKRSGAFCATVSPRYTPWLLINYTGRVRDVSILAHELGHALHSMLAEDHSVLTQHASLPLAETASVFSEMLLTDRLLAAEEDPQVQRDLLAAAVDDTYATVMRQAYFVHFERLAHDALLDGTPASELNRIYRGTLEEQFGDSIELPDEFEREWMMIPHIYQTPFYCYAYSFAQLLVLALYARYLEEGEDFKPGYVRLLSYGGSARPEEILAEAGVNIRDPEFWLRGFGMVESWIARLEELDTRT